MQLPPHEPCTTHADYEELETRCLAQLIDQSADYTVMRPSLLNALGVSDADLRKWESHSTLPPRIETVSMPDDEEEEDIESNPRGGEETEFSLDDPDAEDAEDEDAEKPKGEEDSEDDEDDDEDDDVDGKVASDDDVIVEDDDGEKD